MLTQQPLQSLRLLHARHHPERVVEAGAVFVGGERIVALLVLGTHQVEELPHLLLMHKASPLFLGHVGTLPGAEELLELERGVLAKVGLDELAQVVGAYLHVGQLAVGVVLGRLAGVFLRPTALGTLLLDVVPRVYLLVGEVLIEVERCAGEVECLGVGMLRELLDDTQSEVGACALVRLIHYHEVPVGGEYVCLELLVVVATHKCGAAQILHAGKEDKLLALVGRTLQGIEVALGGVVELGGVVARRAVFAKHLQEVFLPRVVDHRAVGDDDGAAHAVVTVELRHALGEFQGADGLAEAHLGVPEESGTLLVPLEISDGIAHGLLLFVAQLNAAAVEETCALLGLYSLDSSIYRHKPICVLSLCYLFLLPNTKVEK